MPADVRSRRAGAPECSAAGDGGDDSDDASHKKASTFRFAAGAFFAAVVVLLLVQLVCLAPSAARGVGESSPGQPGRHLRPLPAAEQPGQEELLGELEPTALPPVPQVFRHSLQQDAGLPPGPEAPAPTPQSKDDDIVSVRCSTTTGSIMIQVHRNWTPRGAERFLMMVQRGFFDTKVALFRSVRGFICQTGVAGDPRVHREWEAMGTFADDAQWLDTSAGRAMKRGYLAFAGRGENTRQLDFFFTYRDCDLGHSPWEVPFGTLVGEESFQAMDHWYTGYGDLEEFGGHAPSRSDLLLGASHIQNVYPELDFITSCAVSGGSAGQRVSEARQDDGAPVVDAVV